MILGIVLERAGGEILLPRLFYIYDFIVSASCNINIIFHN